MSPYEPDRRTVEVDSSCSWSFFFFNDTATTEIYTLSLHDALPISASFFAAVKAKPAAVIAVDEDPQARRSEEHTSELQSHSDLVCRLLLEKKKRKRTILYSGSEIISGHCEIQPTVREGERMEAHIA